MYTWQAQPLQVSLEQPEQQMTLHYMYLRRCRETASRAKLHRALNGIDEFNTGVNTEQTDQLLGLN